MNVTPTMSLSSVLRILCMFAVYSIIFATVAVSVSKHWVLVEVVVSTLPEGQPLSVMKKLPVGA